MAMVDARRLSKEEQLKLRNDAISLIRKTNDFAETARILGVSKAAVYKWRDQWSKTRNLDLKKRGGKHRLPANSLSDSQVYELEEVLIDHRPCEVGLKKQLWSLTDIAIFIEQRYEIKVKRAEVLRILLRLNYYPKGTYDNGWLRYFDKTNRELCLPKWINAFDKTTRKLYFFGFIKSSNHALTLYAVSPRGHVSFMIVKSRICDYQALKYPVMGKQIRLFSGLLQKTARKDILLFTKIELKGTLTGWKANSLKDKICLTRLWNYMPPPPFPDSNEPCVF